MNNSKQTQNNESLSSLNNDDMIKEVEAAKDDLKIQSEGAKTLSESDDSKSSQPSSVTNHVNDSHIIKTVDISNASEFAKPSELPFIDAVSTEDYGMFDQQVRTLALDMRENRMSLPHEKIALSALPFTEGGRLALILQNERGLDLLTNILKENTRELFFSISSSIRRWSQERSDLMPLLATSGIGESNKTKFQPSYYSLSFTRAGSIVLQSIIAGLSDDDRKKLTKGSEDGLIVDGDAMKSVLRDALTAFISGKVATGGLDELRAITSDIKGWDAMIPFEQQFADYVTLESVKSKSKVLSDDLDAADLNDIKEDIRAFAVVFLRDFCTALYAASTTNGTFFDAGKDKTELNESNAKELRDDLLKTYFINPADSDSDTVRNTMVSKYGLSSFYTQLSGDLERQLGRSSKHIISLRAYTELVRYTHELRDTIIAQVKDGRSFADSSLKKSTELMRHFRTTLNLISAAVTKEDAVSTMDKFVRSAHFKGSLAGLLYNLSHSNVMVDAQHIDELFAIMTDADLILSFNESPVADLGKIRFSGSPVPVTESMRLSNDITFSMETSDVVNVTTSGTLEVKGFSAYDLGDSVFAANNEEVKKIHRLICTSILGSNRVRAEILGGKQSGLDGGWSFGAEARAAVGTLVRQVMTSLTYQFAVVRLSHRTAAAQQIAQLYDVANYTSGLIEFGLSEYHHIGRLDVIKTRISELMGVCDTAISELMDGTDNLQRKRSDNADTALNGRVLPYLDFRSEEDDTIETIDNVFASLIKTFQSTANYNQLKSQVEFVSKMLVRKGQQAMSMLEARDVMSLPENEFRTSIKNIDDIFTHSMQATSVDPFAGLKATKASAKDLRSRSLQVGDRRVYAFHMPISTMMDLMTPKTKDVVALYNSTMKQQKAHSNSLLPADILLTAQSAIGRRLSSHFISHNLVERRSLYANLTKGQAPLRFLSLATSSLEGISHGMSVNELHISVSDTKQMFASILAALALTPKTPVKLEQAALIIDQVKMCSPYAAYPLKVKKSFKFPDAKTVTYEQFLEPNTDFQVSDRKLYDVTRSIYLRDTNILRMIAADTVRVDYSKGQEVMAVDSIGTIRPIKDMNSTTIQLAGSFNFYMGRILTDDHADAVVRNIGRAIVGYLTA